MHGTSLNHSIRSNPAYLLDEEGEAAPGGIVPTETEDDLFRVEVRPIGSTGDDIARPLLKFPHGDSANPASSENSNTPLLAAPTGVEWSVWAAEAKNNWKIAMPIIVAFLLEFLPAFTSLMFVSHLSGKESLDASALATMFSNVTGLSVGFGLTSALDTLCTQAFGAQNTLLIGVYLQRGIYVELLAYIPIFLVNWFAGDILTLIGQPADVAEMAGIYCRYLMIGMPFLFIYELIKKALQSLNIFAPMVYIAVIGNLLNIMCCYLFVFVADMGYIGAALGRSISNIFWPIMLVGYVYRSGIQAYFWPGWSRRGLEGWLQYLSLSIPGMLAMCLEWWAFEVVALMAGWLPDAHTALGAHTVVFNTSALSFMFYLGISTATTVRVGNLVGAGLSKAARRAGYVGLVLSLMIGGCWCAIILGSRQVLPSAFTSDDDIKKVVTTLYLALGAYQFCDALNQTCSGVFRGCGMQNIAAGTNFAGYYLFGLPLAYVFGFQFHWGLEGLWWAVTIGLGLSCTISTIMVLRIDWQRQADEALKRVSE